jgi:hypothetical protein
MIYSVVGGEMNQHICGRCFYVSIDFKSLSCLSIMGSNKLMLACFSWMVLNFKLF